MPFVESFEEFKERQACPFVPTKHRYLFENGAQSDDKRHSDRNC